jgi:hypothetical protein
MKQQIKKYKRTKDLHSFPNKNKKMSLSPSDIIQDKTLQIAHLDVSKAVTYYEDTGKNFLVLGNFRLDKSSFKLSLKGELTTEGVSVSEFNKIPNYSFGIRFDDDADMVAMEALSNILADYLKANGGEDWELTQPVKDDKIYIKLKTTSDKKRFNIVSNIKLDPKKLSDANLTRGQKVEIIGDVGVYCNIPDKKAGVTFSARKVIFEEVQ